jgi:NhaA family Na+:H+ antiporter
MIESMDELDPPLGPDDHVLGSSGPAIVEYGDYQCPYSRAAYRHVQRLQRRLEGEVRFAFRHFPLPEIHPHAQLASEAAEAAAAQNAFWPMHDLLFRRQTALEPDDLRSYATELDLDLVRFEDDLDSGAHREPVEASVRGGRENGVRGIPALFIEGRRHRGDFDVETLIAAVTRIRQDGPAGNPGA